MTFSSSNMLGRRLASVSKSESHGARLTSEPLASVFFNLAPGGFQHALDRKAEFFGDFLEGRARAECSHADDLLVAGHVTIPAELGRQLDSHASLRRARQYLLFVRRI